MSVIFQCRYPIKREVTDDRIRELLFTWGNESPHHEFQNHAISSDEYEGISRSSISNACFSHLETIDCKQGKSYIAGMLERKDTDCNSVWNAEVVFERSEFPTLFISLRRSIDNWDAQANLSELPSYPYIIKTLISEGYVDTDAGLEIGSLHKLSDIDKHTLSLTKDIFLHKYRTSLPFIYFNLVGLTNEFLIRKLMSLASYYSRIAHVFVSRSRTDHNLWCDISHTTSNNCYINFIYPFANLDCKLVFSNSTRWEVIRTDFQPLFHYLFQGFSPEWPFWYYLKSLDINGDSNNTSNGNRQESSKREYVIMNTMIAEQIRRERQQRGMTQSDLAMEANTTGLIISRLERNQTSKVKAILLSNIEKALDMPTGCLSTVITTSVPEVMSIPANSCFCRICGEPLFNDSIFCHKCGTKSGCGG